MTYVQAPATKMLATHCVVCNLPLLDTKSVEIGMGPTCRSKTGCDRKGHPHREIGNRLVHQAACAAQAGDVPEVLRLADQIEDLMFPKVAARIRKRFIQIRIEETEEGWMDVYTPYAPAFLAPFHREVPRNGLLRGSEVSVKRQHRHPTTNRFVCWKVRVGWKRRLLSAMSQTWPGHYAMGSKGVFKIPTPTEFQTRYER